MLRLALIVFLHVDNDRVLALELALQQFLGERIFNALLDFATQRPGAEIEIRTLANHVFLGLVGQDQLQAALAQPIANLRQLDVDDRLQIVLRQVRKTMMSSTRLRNSGRNTFSIRSVTRSFILSYEALPSALRKPKSDSFLIASAPMLVVMIKIVFLKSTCRPKLSVSRPSSMICSSMLKTSGWAFSISSSSTTL